MPGRQLLPTNVKPVSYDLHLIPDLTNFTFKGTVIIDVEVKEDTNSICLHTLELDLHKIDLDLGGNVLSSAVDKVAYDEESHQTTLPFEEVIKAGQKGKLKIEFQGTLNDKMAGFYRSKYEVHGVTKYMATTQFESTDARRAFPCWDEPALKATFTVALTVPNEWQVLGNMPEAQVELFDGNIKKVTFRHTPVMSTYLVAFIVGEFDFIEASTHEGVDVRVYTPIDKSSQGEFALSVATRTLSYFTEYFKMSYPLPKCDLVAIADFASGAMENWGLVTFRETALLLTPTSSISAQQRVAYVVAHELAHQWFGNIVTMEWWKELWLNEGFATWVGNLAVSKFFPQWDIWTRFTDDYFASALSLDALLNTHPIEVEVYSSNEIDEIFDSISYNKGASIIRMLATYLGESVFQRGLQQYLEKHQYANATTDDLWAALSDASGKNVKQLMDNWIKAPGYPLLNVERDGNKFKIAQHRFLLSGPSTDDTSSTVWNCFLGIQSDVKPEPSFVVLSEKEQVIELTEEQLPSGSKWVKLNAGQSGFFRVQYDQQMIEQLLLAISQHELSPLERNGIQADAFALARAGYSKTSSALKIASAFTNETDYTVLSSLVSNLSAIVRIADGQPFQEQLKLFCRKLIAPTVKRLGWDAIPDESDSDKLLRTLVISTSGQYEDQEIVQEALRRFNNNLPIAPDLFSTVYRLAVRFGTKESYDKVLEIYRTAASHTVKLYALQALGATKDEALLKQTLEFAFSDEVRSQDIMYPVSGVGNDIHVKTLAWEFFKANLQRYKDKTSSFLLGYLAKYSTSFNSHDEADEVEAFFKENPTPQIERTVQQILEGIRSRADWLKRDTEDLKQFFN